VGMNTSKRVVLKKEGQGVGQKLTTGGEGKKKKERRKGGDISGTKGLCRDRKSQKDRGTQRKLRG